jgi:acetyl esterase/lipase
MSRLIRSMALAAACAAVSLVATPQNAAPSQTTAASLTKPTLTKADYDKFESISGTAISPDGKWIAYAVGRGERGGGGRGRGNQVFDGEMHYRPTNSDQEKTIVRAGAPTFTSNSRWMLYTLSPASGGGNGGARGGQRGEARGPASGAETPAANAAPSIGIIDLDSGASTVVTDIQSYTLSNDGHHVALRRPAPEGSQNRGAGLIIRDLETDSEVSFGNVAESSWNDDGTLLAMIIDVPGKTGNGVQLFNTATSTIRSLDAGTMLYSDLRWQKKGSDLAAYRSREDAAYVDTGYTVLAWKDLSSANPSKRVYDFTSDDAFPKGMRVASDRAPLWSDDGSTLFFGIASHEPKPDPNVGDTVKIQVWHPKDLREWPQQRNTANQGPPHTDLVAWHVEDSHLVRLADEVLPDVQLSANQKLGLASDERPYFMDVITGRQYRDVYTIDIATGKRTKVLTKAQSMPSMSPTGRYLLYAFADQKSGQWWVMDLTTGKKTDLTSKIASVFVNLEDDHPAAYRRAYGFAGWLADEKSVILYDRFDLWRVGLDGTNPIRLTHGKEDSTVYRAERIGIEENTIDPLKPLLLNTDGEYNKKSGFSRLTFGQPVQQLLWVDENVGGLMKAKDAEVYAFTRQTFQNAPQLNITTGVFTNAKQVSHTNEFLKDYAWSRQQLMNYTNGHGDKLQMMLAYPANYEPGKKYPMVVYYYEKLSQGFHNFVAPSSTAMYNVTIFSQAGYFVLRPDILFQPRNAGPSGLDCVTSAVKAALAAVPDIDPKRVGAMGHSWGGYQSAYYAVHGGDVFAAAIAGAPLTDFISMYGYSSGNTGAPETGHFEVGQERMEVSLWEDPEAYVRNSTVFQTNALKIPLLLEEGEADGNVNYYQSMELYNFGRRLGKNIVFLVYEGENHGLTGAAATDYQQRQLEWFAYWLKKEPPADWIVNGEPYLTRKKILDSANPPSEGSPRGRTQGAPGGRGGRGGGN